MIDNLFIYREFWRETYLRFQYIKITTMQESKDSMAIIKK